MNGVDNARHVPKLNGILPDADPLPRPVESNVRAEPGMSNGEVKVNGTNDLVPSFKDPFKKPPPELQHIDMQVPPLGVLFQRAAQDCFNALTTHMENILDPSRLEPAQRPHGRPNDAAALSAWKKQMWLNFAHEQRQRFIKLHVLLKWAEKAADIGIVIDLREWIGQQVRYFDSTLFFLGEFKREMQRSKVPSPDIDAALEILTTGHTSLLPDFGYIPPEPLSPQKLLSTLRNLNSILHIRLNLYEDLPPFFRDFTIASGRATFSVPAEFEVDLSVASEDPTSPIFFIDFRFLFSPRTEIPAGQLSEQLDMRVNHVLATAGLTGCFQLLHDFTLTHKINILRRQALDLNRTAWAGTLRIDQIHRSLTVQYWRHRPGPKSWIEIGVVSGSQPNEDLSSSTSSPSRLAIRWFRSGKEVKDANLPIDLDNLNIERILTATLARHVSYILTTIKFDYDVQLALNTNTTRAPELEVSDLEPADCVLRLPLRSRDTASVFIESVTGNLVLQPPGPIAVRWQERLNSLSDLGTEAAAGLQKWQGAELQTDIERFAERGNLVPYQGVHLDQTMIRRAFGPSTLRVSLFKGKSWRSDWCIVASMDCLSESWWISDSRRVKEGYWQLRTPEQMQLGPQMLQVRQQHPDHFMDLIEQQAIWNISLSSIAQQLSAHGCTFQTHDESGWESSRNKTVLQINLSMLMRNSIDDASPTPNESKTWASNNPTITIAGFGRGTEANVRYIVKGEMRPADGVVELLSTINAPEVKISPKGAFALVVAMPLGSNEVVHEIKSQLRALERLYAIVSQLKERKYSTRLESLSRVSFVYSRTEDDDNRPAFRIVLPLGRMAKETDLQTLPAANPHRRIRSELLEMLQAGSKNAEENFTRFLDTLECSLPVLEAFDEIESRASALSVMVHVRTLTLFTLSFKPLRCKFDVQFVIKNKVKMWLIRQTGDSLRKKSELKQAVKKIWTTRGRPGVTPLETGCAAEMSAARGVLISLFEAIRPMLENQLPATTAQPQSSDNQQEAKDANLSDKKSAPAKPQANPTANGHGQPAQARQQRPTHIQLPGSFTQQQQQQRASNQTVNQAPQMKQHPSQQGSRPGSGMGQNHRPPAQGGAPRPQQSANHNHNQPHHIKKEVIEIED